jgi:hypothetical protein
MLDGLKKHHIGIVVPPERVPELEERFGKRFHLDAVQGVRVCFRWNPEFGLYEEYFTAEGRASKYKPGFSHVCYEVESREKMDEIDAFLRREKLGFRLTFLEPSGSEECGLVAFYKIRNMGIVEFNVPREDAG